MRAHQMEKEQPWLEPAMLHEMSHLVLKAVADREQQPTQILECEEQRYTDNLTIVSIHCHRYGQIAKLVSVLGTQCNVTKL